MLQYHPSDGSLKHLHYPYISVYGERKEMDNKNRQAEEKREEQNRPERAVSILLIVILLCVFGGIQLFCLGLIGEYVGQVYREVKARPRYVKDIELK